MTPPIPLIRRPPFLSFGDMEAYRAILQHCNGAYNEACDIIEGNQIFDEHGEIVRIKTREEQLKEALFRIELCNTLLDEEIICSEFHSRSDDATRDLVSTLKSESLVLYGNLIGWKDPLEARKSYEKVVNKWNPESHEALLQYARSIWDLSENSDDFDDIESHLKQAIDLQNEEDESETKEGNKTGEETQEAKLLYCRLLCQLPNRRKEALERLAGMGYTFKLIDALLQNNFVHDRVEVGLPIKDDNSVPQYVGVIDNVFPPKVMTYISNLFARESPFWKENLYGSPSKGYFSFQSKKFKDSTKQKATFLNILHHIWNTTARKFPKVKKAKYCEWWAHSRRHTSGHTLHYDYVVDKGKIPRHPIVSSIFFVSANCGNATLVSDQTMKNERTTEACLLMPNSNRLACFDGKHLHCVLPGVGPTPNNSEERRVTMMVAFWEESPNAAKMEEANGKEWSRLFHAQDKAANEALRASKGDCSVNPKGIVYLDKVVEAIPSKIRSGQPQSKRRKLAEESTIAADTHSVDLLGESVFANFGALNSGMYIADPSISCSLNCNGECDVCRGKKQEE